MSQWEVLLCHRRRGRSVYWPVTVAAAPVVTPPRQWLLCCYVTAHDPQQLPSSPKTTFSFNTLRFTIILFLESDVENSLAPRGISNEILYAFISSPRACCMFHPPLPHDPDNVNMNYEAPHYATLSVLIFCFSQWSK
jgi:hypothetical protein